jgi:predicted O-linked N-acetylglucosamine transferase (SPINDLY family)
LATSGRVTFGCFNRPNKVTDAMVQTWAQLLRSLPSSRLLIIAGAGSDEQARAQHLCRFIRCGMDSSQLWIVGRRPVPDYLWMGVPTVTLTGSRFVSRVSASILHQVGLDDLVAHTEIEFVRIACALARDTRRLQELRVTLRNTMRQSSLTNAQLMVGNFENAILDAWRRLVSSS